MSNTVAIQKSRAGKRDAVDRLYAQYAGVSEFDATDGRLAESLAVPKQVVENARLDLVAVGAVKTERVKATGRGVGSGKGSPWVTHWVVIADRGQAVSRLEDKWRADDQTTTKLTSAAAKRGGRGRQVASHTNGTATNGAATNGTAAERSEVPEIAESHAEATSRRSHVLLFLLEHKSEKYTSREIAQGINEDIKKVEYTIDNLRKHGRVKANKTGSNTSGSSSAPGQASPSGDHRIWYNIQLTNQGMADARSLLPGARVRDAEDRQRADARAEAIREREAAARSTQTQPSATIELPAPEPAPEPVRDHVSPSAAEYAGENEPDIIDEAYDPGSTPVLTQAPPQATAPEHALPQPHVLGITEIPSFPLINQLLERSRYLSQAAKLIERATPQDARRSEYEDLMLTVLGKLDDLTPIEREIIAYIEKHGETEDA